MGSKWETEQVIQLITSFEKHDCLYNSKNPDYHNKHLRTVALKDILAAVSEVRPGTTTKEIENKLHGLRSQFTVEHKKVLASTKSGTGTDSVYVPTLWYYKYLLFLADHFVPRNSLGSKVGQSQTPRPSSVPGVSQQSWQSQGSQSVVGDGSSQGPSEVCSQSLTPFLNGQVSVPPRRPSSTAHVRFTPRASDHFVRPADPDETFLPVDHDYSSPDDAAPFRPDASSTQVCSPSLLHGGDITVDEPISYVETILNDEVDHDETVIATQRPERDGTLLRDSTIPVATSGSTTPAASTTSSARSSPSPHSESSTAPNQSLNFRTPALSSISATSSTSKRRRRQSFQSNTSDSVLDASILSALQQPVVVPPPSPSTTHTAIDSFASFTGSVLRKLPKEEQTAVMAQIFQILISKTDQCGVQL